MLPNIYSEAKNNNPEILPKEFYKQIMNATLDDIKHFSTVADKTSIFILLQLKQIIVTS